MNRKRSKILISFIFVTLILSECTISDHEIDQDNKIKYSISLGEFKTQEEAVKLKPILESKLNSTLRIEKTVKNKYQLLFSDFVSSFEAGETAFDLYSNSLIQDYRIVHKGKPVVDNFTNVLFVANYMGRPSVYSFNLLTKQSSVEWSRWGRKVISLNHSIDNQSAFITTMLGYGRQSRFPYIHEARIYFLNRVNDQADELAELGDGVQLYTYWESSDTFKVNFSTLDSVNSKVVIQNIYPFDINGKSGLIQKRKFDLLKEGFPSVPRRNPVELSPNKEFQFRNVRSDGESNIYLKNLKQRSEELVVTTKRNINDARWSEDGNYLFIITDNQSVDSKGVKAEKTGELFIIDAINMKIVRIFSGFRFENVLVHGKLLFFDERLKDIAQIAVYDYTRDKLLNTISLYGGCGINNLPM
ncbi:MAG: hypothetical protein HY963_00725 [Ignavibacteriales bacterium]|nr:hypothetical protein [Ignavibacteriales bacterium]